MGGHGGLNILPQKRWNVYNFDNREKVRLDEEAAAKEEQLKREQSRKRDTEFRAEKLRQARGLSTRRCDQVEEEAKEDPPAAPVEIESSAKPIETASDSKHINLFEGIKIFDPIEISNGKGKEKKGKFSRDENRNKKVKKEEVRVVGPEDAKYRLGYGVAGKGVKLPWYMEQRVADERNSDQDDWEEYGDTKLKGKRKICGKKTVEELREERLKREKLEREKERDLLMARSKKDGRFSSRRR